MSGLKHTSIFIRVTVNEGFEINSHKLERSYDRVPCEKLNLSFAKFVLGIHKKAQNSATRGELGRYPLAIPIIDQVLKYFNRLSEMNNESLLSKAYFVCNLVSGKNARRVFGKAIKLKENLQQSSSQVKCQSVKVKLQDRYRTSWEYNIKHETKMRFCAELKSFLCFKNYLEHLNWNALAPGQIKNTQEPAVGLSERCTLCHAL